MLSDIRTFTKLKKEENYIFFIRLYELQAQGQIHKRYMAVLV